MLTNLLKLFRLKRAPSKVFPKEPVIYPRDKHPISRQDISENALKVLYRLKKKDFRALLVGGSVRDILLKKSPKDFDVATDALPEQMRRVFRNCRLIGRRFRLAHIHFGREIVEVATFRAHHGGASNDKGRVENGMILRDNVYGTLEEDAFRRDFTVNALYYDINDFSIVDYCGGMQDLTKRVLRMIGDPEVRFREDPVRLLRAVRLAAKLDFTIEKQTEAQLLSLGNLLENIPSARLFEEMQKIFFSSASLQTYLSLQKHQLFQYLFPLTAESLNGPLAETSEKLLHIAFRNTDQRIAEDKRVTPAFILAVLLWPPLVERMNRYHAEGAPEFTALQQAMEEVISAQTQRIAIPRRFVQGMREIWQLQLRLSRRHARKVERLMELHRFRAAYDFLLIRAEAGEDVKELSTWWTDFIDADLSKRDRMVKALGTGPKRRRRGRPTRKVPDA